MTKITLDIARKMTRCFFHFLLSILPFFRNRSLHIYSYIIEQTFYLQSFRYT